MSGRVEKNPGEYILIVTRPNGECSKIKVSNPACGMEFSKEFKVHLTHDIRLDMRLLTSYHKMCQITPAQITFFTGKNQQLRSMNVININYIPEVAHGSL